MHFSFTARIASIFTKHFPQPLDGQGSIPSCFAFLLVLFIIFKFDCQSHIPIQYLKTLVSVKIYPKLCATQPDLAVLSLLLIQARVASPAHGRRLSPTSNKSRDNLQPALRLANLKSEAFTFPLCFHVILHYPI